MEIGTGASAMGPYSREEMESLLIPARTNGDLQPRSRVGVCVWKITKRKHQGEGEFFRDRLNSLLAEGRPGWKNNEDGERGLIPKLGGFFLKGQKNILFKTEEESHRSRPHLKKTPRLNSSMMREKSIRGRWRRILNNQFENKTDTPVSMLCPPLQGLLMLGEGSASKAGSKYHLSLHSQIHTVPRLAESRCSINV